MFKGVLVDLDGVVYQNASPIPGAISTLDWLVKSGIPHLFVTNTTSSPKSAIVNKLGHMGFKASTSQILTPMGAAVSYLKTQGAKTVVPFVVTPTLEDLAPLALWDSESLVAPDALLVGDMGSDWSFARMNEAFRLLMEYPQCELVALGMTRYFRGANGLQLDVGPIVQALSFAVDIDPVVMGKPSAIFFHKACEIMGLPPSEVCMVGDDARSDVAAAQAAGLRGMQVKTGKFQARDLVGFSPDYVIDTLSGLPKLMAVD